MAKTGAKVQQIELNIQIIDHKCHDFVIFLKNAIVCRLAT